VVLIHLLGNRSICSPPKRPLELSTLRTSSNWIYRVGCYLGIATSASFGTSQPNLCRTFLIQQSSASKLSFTGVWPLPSSPCSLPSGRDARICYFMLQIALLLGYALLNYLHFFDQNPASFVVSYTASALIVSLLIVSLSYDCLSQIYLAYPLLPGSLRQDQVSPTRRRNSRDQSLVVLWFGQVRHIRRGFLTSPSHQPPPLSNEEIG